jgi:hypothetical protein
LLTGLIGRAPKISPLSRDIVATGRIFQIDKRQRSSEKIEGKPIWFEIVHRADLSFSMPLRLSGSHPGDEKRGAAIGENRKNNPLPDKKPSV